MQIFEKAYATGDCGWVGGERGSKRLLHGKRSHLVPQQYKENSLRLKSNLTSRVLSGKVVLPNTDVSTPPGAIVKVFTESGSRCLL